MAKKVKQIVKMILPAGQFVPAPPFGPIISQAGVNIKDFQDQFNGQTKADMGTLTPIELRVYEDRTFSFVIKTPPVSELIRKMLKIKHGSGRPNLQKVGKLTKEQVRTIAEKKLPDLNTGDVDAAMKIVEGTARQMGIDIKG